MKKYTDFLITGDEKILFINNIAPVLPYSGAFIAINKWNYKKSMIYLELGAALKFSILLTLSNTFYILFKKGVAQTATFLLIIITISISFLLSYLRKRKIYVKRK